MVTIIDTTEVISEERVNYSKRDAESARQADRRQHRPVIPGGHERSYVLGD